jgi:hypothetical protein
MRKTLLMLAAAFLFAVSPAFAQHGGGHAGGGHGFGGGSHAASHESHNSGTARNASNASHGTREGGYTERHNVTGAPHAGYHYSGGGYARNYYHGGRYDHEYFSAHWGYGNRFYMAHCNWWGPRFGVGSYFWFGGGYWTIIEPIPPYWYDDEVYVDYVDGYGYALVNPVYPGVYFHVGVRF